MMTRRRRTRGLARSHATREPRRRLLIVCEGKITEPKYLAALRYEHKNRLVDIEFVPDGGVPKTLVEYAVERKRGADKEARRTRDSFYKYDEVWCVFDVDEHPRLAEAKQQATDNGLILAISNPCFELWLLLHFRDQTAELSRAEAQRACRDYIPGYQKTVPSDRVSPLYSEAVRRAVALDNWQKTRDNVGGNPSSGIYHLTERVRELGRDAFLRPTLAYP